MREQKSKLDPYKAIIDGWLEEDRRRRKKQRHTIMASGKPLVHDSEKKSVEINRETGEVVLRLKLLDN